jgi:hypothetical protein
VGEFASDGINANPRKQNSKIKKITIVKNQKKPTHHARLKVVF